MKTNKSLTPKQIEAIANVMLGAIDLASQCTKDKRLSKEDIAKSKVVKKNAEEVIKTLYNLPDSESDFERVMPVIRDVIYWGTQIAIALGNS